MRKTCFLPFCICENKDADRLCGKAQLISAFVFPSLIVEIPVLFKSENLSL